MKANVAHKHDFTEHVIEKNRLLDPFRTCAMKVAGASACSFDCEELSIPLVVPTLRLDSASVAGSSPVANRAAFRSGTDVGPVSRSSFIRALVNLAERVRRQQAVCVCFCACCRTN